MKEGSSELGIQLGLRLGTSEIRIKAPVPTDSQRKRARVYIGGRLMEMAQKHDPVVATFDQSTKPSDIQAIRALVEECQELNVPLTLKEEVTSEIFNESGRIPLASNFVLSLRTPTRKS